MENHSTFDCSIRNVDVRLNDSLAGSNVNGDCMNSYLTSVDDSKVTHFNEKDDEESSSNLDELVGDLREKLHVCKDSNNCNLINGCHKTIHEDLKLVDFSLNGLSKSNKLEILNSHIDEVNLRTCEQLTNCVENTRINREFIENESTSIEVNTNCLHTEPVSSIKNDCNDHPSACCTAHVVKNDSVASSSSYIREIPSDVNITYLGYDSESQMPDIMRLIQKDLSEPYSIYTYRYFIHNWPKLCFLAQYGDRCVGAIVCKLDVHKKQSRRGYIAMLAVDEKYRKKKIGSNLVLKAIHAMVEDNADEVVLETEITNQSALKLYENLGFVRDKRLFRYYLNGVDALRLKLWLR